MCPTYTVMLNFEKQYPEMFKMKFNNTSLDKIFKFLIYCISSLCEDDFAFSSILINIWSISLGQNFSVYF